MFYVNPLPDRGDTSISSLIFSETQKMKYSRLSSAAVVIGTLRLTCRWTLKMRPSQYRQSLHLMPVDSLASIDSMCYGQTVQVHTLV